ncbi:MAG TPA: hypothetical protein DGH68_05350 [Bacteroidetes bacterium]|nr:hypothetical protein [Bacteroidota bacterium]
MVYRLAVLFVQTQLKAGNYEQEWLEVAGMPRDDAGCQPGDALSGGSKKGGKIDMRRGNNGQSSSRSRG